MSVLATITMAGLIGLAGQAAGAQPTSKAGPKVTTFVGRYVVRGLGKGKNFSLASCTSDSTVACQVDPNHNPRNAAELWCLSPTAPSSNVTAAYNPTGNRPAINPSTLAVTCKTPKTLNVTMVNGQGVASFPAVKGHNVPSFTMNSTCSTTLPLGVSCTTSGEAVFISCQVNVYFYGLPASGTATVTINSGPSVIDGQSITFPFQCRL
ncbi:MAG: hypothetical protein KGJ77_06835 [Acidobacteriota bacterium]|nr:hypothetical protein [Acidobacteriota bacterium]